jgi:hypothetical protein
MNDQSTISDLKMLENSEESTSSLESADGTWPLDLEDFQKIEWFGQGHVRVNRFPLLGIERESRIRDICGPSSFASSPSVTLQQSLESKLRLKMEEVGSVHYEMTWKHWNMPLGGPICALRALAPLQNGSGFIGWQSPRARSDAGGRRWRARKAVQLEDQARIFALDHGLTEDTVAQLSLSPTFCRRLMGYPIEWDYCGGMGTR